MEEERRTHATEIKVHVYSRDWCGSCWYAGRVSRHPPLTSDLGPCFSVVSPVLGVQRLEEAVESARQGQRQAAEQADAVAKLAKVLMQEQV